MTALRMEEVKLELKERGENRVLLHIPGLDVKPGESLGIAGPSGGGKTTLLYTLAGLQPPTSGKVLWDGADIYALSESRRDALRAQQAGMVFQDFRLVGGLSALDNVLLPVSFHRLRVSTEVRKRALDLLERLGVSHPRTRAEKLSRGEMQRVGLARAFLGSCRVLFADEPTASLDPDNARVVADMLRELCRERGVALICVTHDARLLAGFDSCIRLQAGSIQEAAA